MDFALVMATGIVSIGCYLMGSRPVAVALFALNCVAYVVIWALSLLRLRLYPRRVLEDLTSHQRGLGFLTVVAGTGVLGAQVIVIGHEFAIAIGLLGLAVVLWGGMLYIWIISLIFYRYTFFRFEPDDLAPPYWINMGAMAISTLAGSLLILNSTVSAGAPFLHSLRPFLEGFTVFYWATGTWWIPIIAILAVWRYGYRRLPLEFDPLPQVFLGLALVAWPATFIGLLRRLAHNLGIRRSPRLEGG